MCLLFNSCSSNNYETFCTRTNIGMNVGRSRVYIEFCVRHFLAEFSGVSVHRIQMYLTQRNHSGMQMHRSMRSGLVWVPLGVFIDRPEPKLAYQQLDLHLSKQKIQMHPICSAQLEAPQGRRNNEI